MYGDPKKSMTFISLKNKYFLNKFSCYALNSKNTVLFINNENTVILTVEA